MKSQIFIQNNCSQSWKKWFMFLLLFWLGINFIQSVFTEIMSDEAYYFLYGENLSWGYFDHPPMVGLMTFISNMFFGGNLSVRFVTVVLQIFTLILVWKIISDKLPDISKVILFFTVSASLVMFQAYGFVTTPDVPLLFFAALFLLAYKKFLDNGSWANTFFLAFSMTGMVYSKYHAVLIIGFIFLSNWRLLFNYKVWFAGLLAILLLAPHFYWQIANDFPSFKYHLNDRSSIFKWNYFFEFIPNQLAVFNPFTFGAAIYVIIKYKPKDIFERGLYFLIVGVIAFFWISSFRGHVEPHWTVVCSLPIIILLYRRSLENRKLMNYVKKIIAPSILLVLTVRVLLIAGALPEKLGFSGKKEKCVAIESVAGNLPVVFSGSFQNPSNYHFFTGNESFVLSAIDSRLTQFDIYEKELAYQGKPVFVAIQDNNKSREYTVNGISFSGYFAKNFQSVNRLKIKYDLTKTNVCKGDTLHIPFEIENPENINIDFEHPEFPVILKVAYAGNFKKSKWNLADCELAAPIHTLPAHTTVSGNLTTVVPELDAGKYRFTLTLANPLCAAKNSSNILLKIGM